MDKEILADQSFRVGVLTNVSQNGALGHKPVIGAGGITAADYEHLGQNLHRVTIHALPSDTLQEPEIWRQTDGVYNAATGFKAMAFIRENADGSVYMDESGKPQVMVTFPGNTGSTQDIKIAKAFIAGDGMYDRFLETQNFLDTFSQRLKSEYPNGQVPQMDITIGSHSMGVLSSMGTATELQARLGENINTNTILLEPIGGGLALEQWSIYKTAEQRFGRDMTAEEIDEIEIGQSAAGEIRNSIVQYGRQMGQNVSTILSDDDTFFRLKLGKDLYDSAGVGDIWRYKSPDGGITDLLTDHTIESINSSLLLNGADALSRTETEDLDTDSILHGGRALSSWEYLLEQIKTVLFTFLQSLSSKFGNNASGHAQAPPREPATPPPAATDPALDDAAPDVDADLDEEPDQDNETPEPPVQDPIEPPTTPTSPSTP